MYMEIFYNVDGGVFVEQEDIKYVDLFMMHEDLSSIEEKPLPYGYSYVFYEPGMEKDWILIQLAAKQFQSYEEGQAVFDRTFRPYENQLSKWMLFIRNDQGKCIATATAFFTNDYPGIKGKLHWVAVDEEYQSKGLSKPLLTRTLKQMQMLGYVNCMLHTQTTTWIAVSIYLSLGFLPYQLQDKIEGWNIIKELTNHPALKDL